MADGRYRVCFIDVEDTKGLVAGHLWVFDEKNIDKMIDTGRIQPGALLEFTAEVYQYWKDGDKRFQWSLKELKNLKRKRVS